MKKVILSIIIIFIGFSMFIICGLYLMEIEDRYGDLQQVYFDSKNGDIIINKQTKKYGIITKNWKRVNILTKEKDTIDLEDLIIINRKENKYEVLRSDDKLNIDELDFGKIMELKKNGILEDVIKN